MLLFFASMFVMIEASAGGPALPRCWVLGLQAVAVGHTTGPGLHVVPVWRASGLPWCEDRVGN